MRDASAYERTGRAATVLLLASTCQCSVLFDLNAIDQDPSPVETTPHNEASLIPDSGTDAEETTTTEVTEVRAPEAGVQGGAMSDTAVTSIETGTDAANGAEDEPDTAIDAQGATSKDAASATEDASDAGELDGGSCVPVARGLLGHWTMDNTTINATQLTDTSGNGNNGTLVGFPTPATAPGKFGQALAYPSSSTAYVTIPTLGLNQSSGTVNSVSLWYYRAASPTVDDVLILLPDSPRYDLWLGEQASSYFLCFNTGSSDCYGVQNSTLHDRWVHVVAMFWNGPTVQSSLYIDGQNASPACLGGSGFSGSCGVQRSVAVPVLLGGQHDFMFHGLLDEIRIYDRALTAGEITALYKNTACP
jgi:hypothetical protein